MLCDAFEQTLALARGTAAGPAGSPSAPAAHPHGGTACAGATPTDVPPGLTAEERVAWERDGMFWRRAVFSRERAAQMKAALRRPCSEEAAPLGMVSGPGARVFFADDPTEPPCISEVATARRTIYGDWARDRVGLRA